MILDGISTFKTPQSLRFCNPCLGLVEPMHAVLKGEARSQSAHEPDLGAMSVKLIHSSRLGWNRSVLPYTLHPGSGPRPVCFPYFFHSERGSYRVEDDLFKIVQHWI